MFDWIKDFLVATGTLLSPIVMVHAWQGGVILRYGRGHRVLTPGYYWKWPFFEDIVLYEACETTIRLPPQSLTTKDDRELVVSSIVKYEIKDGMKYVCDVWDQVDVLADTVMGAIGDYVEAHTREELRDAASMKRDVLKAVREGVNRYGFKIHAMTFPDKCRSRSLRLVMPNAKDLAN